MTGFFTGGASLGAGGALTEVEGSAVVAVLVEAASSDSDSLSVISKGCLITGAASMKLKGSMLVPLPKKVTTREKNSLQSVPRNAMVRCCKASLRRAAAFPSNSAARQKR